MLTFVAPNLNTSGGHTRPNNSCPRQNINAIGYCLNPPSAQTSHVARHMNVVVEKVAVWNNHLGGSHINVFVAFNMA